MQPWPAAAYDGNFRRTPVLAPSPGGKEGPWPPSVVSGTSPVPPCPGAWGSASPPRRRRRSPSCSTTSASSAPSPPRPTSRVGAEEEVWSEVKGYLHEMAAAHDDRTAQGWARLGDWFLRAYDVLVDEDDMQELRRLDRSHSLALAFSHRSYLDGMVIPNALSSRRFSPTYTFGGANLNLPVIGTVASRTGLIFIRRATQEIPVYRLALRSYIRQMVTNKRNLAWSIEGGRTRTGKLRPPVHGILKYLTDTVQGDGRDRSTGRARRAGGAAVGGLRPAARGVADDRGGARRQQDAGGLALAGALRAAAAQPARPRLPDRRRAVLAARADGRAGRRGRHRPPGRRAGRPRHLPPAQPRHPGHHHRDRLARPPRRRPRADGRRGPRHRRAARRLHRRAAVARRGRRRPPRPLDHPSRARRADPQRRADGVRPGHRAGLEDRRRPAPGRRVLPQHRHPHPRRARHRRARAAHRQRARAGRGAAARWRAAGRAGRRRSGCATC